MPGFWIFMLIICLLAPVSMIGFGKYFMNGGPEEINSVMGYRTARSMKSKETWEFAHKYFGKIWFVAGFVLLLPSIAAMAFVYGRDIDAVADAGLIIVIVQTVVMVISIFPTEAALKKNFDENGKRR